MRDHKYNVGDRVTYMYHPIGPARDSLLLFEIFELIEDGVFDYYVKWIKNLSGSWKRIPGRLNRYTLCEKDITPYVELSEDNAFEDIVRDI